MLLCRVSLPSSVISSTDRCDGHDDTDDCINCNSDGHFDCDSDRWAGFRPADISWWDWIGYVTVYFPHD
jgi:hypothetical protein